MKLYNEIKNQLDDAALKNEKTATFHFLVLQFSDVLQDVDKHQFCRAVGMPKSFASEFSKMIALSRIMKERDIILATPV